MGLRVHIKSINLANRIDKASTPYLYCIDKFIEQLGNFKFDIIEKMNVNKPMVISEEE